MQVTPLFCCGAPRSGTTIVQSILDTHEKISMTYEQAIVSLHWKFMGAMKLREKKDTTVFSLQQEDYEITRKLMNKRIAQAIFDYHALRKPDALYIGDKLPYYINMLDFIRENYPNSKFIITKRNDKETYESMLKLFKGTIDEKLISHIFMSCKVSYNANKDKPDCHIIHLEELKENPKLVMSGVAKFLNIEDSFDCSLLHGKNDSL